VYNLCLKREIPIGKIRNLKEVFELPEAQAQLLKFKNKTEELVTVSSIAFKIEE
jgi:hypothetical protein